MITRKGPAASLTGLAFGLFLLGAIIYWQASMDLLDVQDGYGLAILSNYPGYFYMTGNLVMTVYLFINRADLRRWFPARSKG